MRIIQNYIDGKSTSVLKNFLNVKDPSTGENTAKVVISDEDDFNNVVSSSKKSQQEWSSTTPLKRSRIL